MLRVNVELFEHSTSLRVSVESLSDIIKKRCIVFDMRTHCNSALFVCTCIELNSVQLRVFAFSLCDNWISFD